MHVRNTVISRLQATTQATLSIAVVSDVEGWFDLIPWDLVGTNLVHFKLSKCDFHIECLCGFHIQSRKRPLPKN